MKGEVVKVKKRKVFILIISLVVTIIVVLGVSYALLQKNVVSDNGKIIYKVGDLEVKLDESGSKDISLTNAMPTEDSDGLKNEPYSFSLVNNGSQRLKYTIYLEDDTDAKNKCGTNCELISDEFIRYNLATDEKTLKTDSLSSNDSKIYTGIISGNSTDKLSLRVWLSINADNSVMNKYYFGKLRVETTYISNEDLDSLCLNNGGDLVVDDECRKYYVLKNNIVNIEKVTFGYEGDGKKINRSYDSNTRTWTVSYEGSNKWFGTQIIPTKENVTHLYYGRFKSTSPNHMGVSEYNSYDNRTIYNETNIIKQNDNFYSFYYNLLNNIDIEKITSYKSYLLYNPYPVTTTLSDTYYLSDYMIIDLTLMFGEGNEPSRDWCDENLNTYIEYNDIGVKTPISEINYKEKTSYYDVIDLFN